MPRAGAGWYQRSAKPYLPYVGHITRGVVRLDDGSLLAMWRLRGVPHELAAPSERNAAARALNAIWRGIADDNVSVAAHLVRHKVTAPHAAPVFRNDFARRFSAAYRDRVLLDQIYRNDWLLSVIVSPRTVPVGSKKFRSGIMRALARFKKIDPAEVADISTIEEIAAQIEQDLAAYHLVRLGVRPAAGRLFSEIAEALRLILTARFEPVPLVNGPLGNSVYTDQVVFERRIHRILPPGVDDESHDGPGVRWSVIFGLREYMEKTTPAMLDEVLRLDMPLVLSQSLGFMSRARAVSALDLKRSQMKAAGDPATKQRKQLKRAANEVGGGRAVRGSHHFSLAVGADTYPDLVANAPVARTALANSGVVVVPETAGNEAAYFAQLPGNTYWRTRPASISSRNFADLAGFGAFPSGEPEGRWGPALITFKTTAGTAYDFVPHVEGDVGMTAIFGRITSGKTVLLMTLLAMFDQCLGKDGVVFFFDKDRGGELLVRAVGGAYLEVRSGEPSGWAPLRGLSNSPADLQFLGRLTRAMILSDGLGPIPAEDHGRIARGIASIMRKPIHIRSFAGVRQYLGWRDPLGAGPRLEPWCRGREFGWFFDGDRDDVNVSARMIGTDLTKILDQPTLVALGAQYQMYRWRSVMDGRRAVIALDECRAYLLHEQFQTDTEDFILTARKNEAIVILCTQQPEHLLKGTFGPTVVNQCMTKIFFRNPDADEKVYRDKLFLTEGEFTAVKDGMPPGSRQFLLKRDSGSAIIDFDLSPLSEFVEILSGRAKTVREAERLREEHPEDWVDKFMSRNREKEAAD